MNDFRFYYLGNGKYQVAGYNSAGRSVDFEISEDEALSVKDILERFNQERDPLEIKNDELAKAKEEAEKEKQKVEEEKKQLEEDNMALTNKKNELLEKWAKDQNPAVLIENKDDFPRPFDSMQIFKGHHYNYAGTLYQAKDNFIYDNQKSPLLEPDSWHRVGDPVVKPTDLKVEYEAKFKKAVDWYADKTYVKTDLVRYYNKLYELVAEKSSGHNPEKEPEIWKLIPKPE